MKKELLVIYDLDLEYGNGLLSYLLQKKDFPYEVKLVTSEKSLEQLQGEIAVLLTDETFEGVDFGKTAGQVVYLSEEDEDSRHINRFQSVDKIAERIAGFSLAPVVHKQNTFSKTKIIGVYSPAGGCGKTAAARELASIVSRSGMKVYRIDFNLIPEKLNNGRIDFYYNLQQKVLFEEDNFEQSFTCENGIYSMNTSLYSMLLWNLKRQDITYLIEGLHNRQETACYIFDIGFLNESVVTLLESADIWIAPCLQKLGQDVKSENLRSLLLFQGKEHLLDKKADITNISQLAEIVEKWG